MKKKIILFITVLITSFCFSQNEISKPLTKYQQDSTYRSFNFISLADVQQIIKKPTMLQDSTFKNSGSLVRYSLTYIAIYKDSTSKGRLFFTYEQYKDKELSKNIFSTANTGNEKGTATVIKELGDEAFMVKDNLNFPFIMARKNNVIFKFKIYYLSEQTSLDELLKLARKVVATH